MQTVQTDLTIIGAHTQECKVFWKGQEIPNAGVSIHNENGTSRVVLKVAEEPLLADMQAAGIVIRRVTP